MSHPIEGPELLYRAFWIFIWGGLGTSVRYLCILATSHLTHFPIPPGTLAANTLACLIFGFGVAFFARVTVPMELQILYFTGFLGGLSTFSSLIGEVYQFLTTERGGMAVTLLAIHILVGLVAFWGGIHLCRLVMMGRS